MLYTLNGEYVVVEQVQHEILEKPVWVYNFEVASDHTYFVGENGVGVHNVCEIKEVFSSIKSSPNYPDGFTTRTNGTKNYNINNAELYEKLREIESGKWYKVYKDGYSVTGEEISIHYFTSGTGKVFDVKVHTGWSNP